MSKMQDNNQEDDVENKDDNPSNFGDRDATQITKKIYKDILKIDKKKLIDDLVPVELQSYQSGQKLLEIIDSVVEETGKNAHQNKKEIIDAREKLSVAKIIDDILANEKLCLKIIEGLEADTEKGFPDHSVRLKYIELILKIKSEINDLNINFAW